MNWKQNKPTESATTPIDNRMTGVVKPVILLLNNGVTCFSIKGCVN